jgi:hypothetical protein
MFPKKYIKGNNLIGLDLHVHSSASSDAFSSPTQIINKAQRLNIGVAIADHNEINGVIKACRQCKGILIIPGIEIKTGEGVHVLFYFEKIDQLDKFYHDVVLNKKRPGFFINIDTIELIKKARSHNCLIGFPHPYAASAGGCLRLVHRGLIKENNLISLVDFIETKNTSISAASNNFTATREYSTSSTPSIISNTINDLFVTENTSTALGTENTVFLATDSGTSVIQEHTTQASSTVQNYYNQGTAGSSQWTNSAFKGAVYLDGSNDYLQVADASSLDIASNDLTVESFFKLPSAFDSTTNSANSYLVAKGGNYRMYLDSLTGKLNFELGTKTPLGASAARVLMHANDAGRDTFYCVEEYNGYLYAGQGYSWYSGTGDVYVYDGEKWTLSFDGQELSITALASFNGYLYAGQGEANNL